MSYYPLYYQIDSGLNLAKAPIIMGSASGSIASFPDGAADLPVQSLKVAIDPVQDLHGYEAPWPAGSGKNLFNYADRTAYAGDNANPESIISIDESKYIFGITASGYITTSAGPINMSIESNTISATSTVAWYGIGFVIAVKPNTTYTISYSSLVGGIGYSFYDSQSKYITGRNSGGTLTTPENCKYIIIILLSGSSGNNNISVTDLQLEVGSTATSYAPYSNICPITGWDGVNVTISPTTDAEDGTTYNIAFPAEAGTVYGGTLTINEDGSGVLVVDRAQIIITGNTFAWSYSSDGQNKYRVSTASLQAIIKQQSVLKTNYLKYDYPASSYPDEWVITISSTRNILIGVPASITSLTDFRNYLNDNNLQLVYELSTPVTYTLTAPQIRTLLGTNNIWADTGDVDVDYRADTKLYIEQLTQPDSDMIADSNITSGTFFMVGNTLYLSTSAIEQGGAIVPGTNCTEMSLADALNSLNT